MTTDVPTGAAAFAVPSYQRPTGVHPPLDSPGYPSALQNAVATAVQNDPIHIWLYTNPRIFAYRPTVSGIPSDLVQQRQGSGRLLARSRAPVVHHRRRHHQRGLLPAR